MESKALFTIGYQGLSLDTLLSLLQAHAIATVVDVRELPLSRKPGFSKKSLAAALAQAGIGYCHMAELGCPRPIRHRLREDGDWPRYAADFMAYLNTRSAAVADLAALAERVSCALLCYEADFNFCHRTLVADAVHEHSGAPARHITAGIGPPGATSPRALGRR